MDELKKILKTALHVDIESELLTKAKEKAKSEKLKLNQVVEHYLKQFVETKGVKK